MLTPLFRTCLRLLPRHRRSQHGDAMVEVFEALARDARARAGFAGAARLMLREVMGMFRFSLRERLATRRRGQFHRWHPTAELRWAYRAVLARWRQTTFAVLLLAITLGANGVVFSVADSLAFTRDVYPEGDRLVIVQGHDPKSSRTISGFPADLFAPLRAQTDVLAAVHGTTGSTVLLNRGGEPVNVRAAWVTPGLFEMLGGRPLAGRVFTDEDAGADAASIAIIREDLAREHFADPRDAVGQTLTAATGMLRIVGVMPASFRYPGGLDRLWRPYDLSRREGGRVPSMFAVARLARGVTAEQAAQALAARSAAITPMTTTARGWPYTIALGSFAERFGTASPRVFWFLLLAAGGLLLTACASIASVELATAVTRARTFAIAAALGASRASLMRSVVLEAAIVVGAAVFAGAALAAWGTAFVAATLPAAMTVRSTNLIDVDLRTLAFMSAAGAVTWLVAALPVLHFALRQRAASVMATESRSTTGSHGAAIARRALTALQVGVAVCLLIGSTLGLRSYLGLLSQEKGFDSANLVSIEVTIPPSLPRDPAGIEHIRLQVIERLRSLPTTVAATSADAVPPVVGGERHAGPMQIDGDTAPAGMAVVIRTSVTPEYFSVLRLPLRAGRMLTAADPRTNVLVSEAFAAQYFRGRPAVGGRFRVGNGDWNEIVGVVARVRNEFDRLGAPSTVEHEIYQTTQPIAVADVTSARGSTFLFYELSFAVRVTDIGAVPQVLEAVRAIDHRLLARADVVDDLYGVLLSDTRITTAVISTFGALSFVVALAGVYGVMAFLVAGRRREIAIRMALGADQRAVASNVVRSAMRFVAAGAVIGLGAAWAGSRALESQLFGITATDPATYGAIALVVCLAAMAATWHPAQRASRIDPAVTLRSE